MLVGVVALLLAACSNPSRPAATASVKAPKDRKAAPEFALKDSTGKTVRLSDFRGKVVLLNVWATNCGPCRVEIPWFMEFEQKHKDRGLVVLGIAMDDDGWEVVKPYLERQRVNYRVVMGTPGIADLYGGVEAIPTTFLIDREGRVARVHIGLVGKREYQNDIDKLLAGEASALLDVRGADFSRAGVGAN